MKLLDDKLFIENNNDIDLLRDEYPLFDAIKMLIEELCIEIEDNGTNDDLINSLQYAFCIYCIICDKYNIFTLNANGLYNEFIKMLKKNYMN